jgi:hypothetical protein
MCVDSSPTSIIKDTPDHEVFHKLEGLTSNRLKIPMKHQRDGSLKITRSQAGNFIEESKLINSVGKRSFNEHNMAEIMKHSYL